MMALYVALTLAYGWVVLPAVFVFGTRPSPRPENDLVAGRAAELRREFKKLVSILRNLHRETRQ